MKPDITLNGTSMNSLGWLRESISFPVPKSQTNTIVVPGRNSPIRYTEALGRVSFEPRSFSIVLTMLGTRAKFNEMVTNLVNPYSGRLLKVITSEDPDLYVVGTVQMEQEYDPLSGKGQVTCSCEDGDSYRYHCKETEVTVTGGGTVVLQNDFMPVIPEILTTGDTTISWSIGNDSFRKTLGAGKWTVPELELISGKNSIQLSGTGTTTFRYREGCL